MRYMLLLLITLVLVSCASKDNRRENVHQNQSGVFFPYFVKDSVDGMVYGIWIGPEGLHVTNLTKDSLEVKLLEQQFNNYNHLLEDK